MCFLRKSPITTVKMWSMRRNYVKILKEKLKLDALYRLNLEEDLSPRERAKYRKEILNYDYSSLIDDDLLNLFINRYNKID